MTAAQNERPAVSAEVRADHYDREEWWDVCRQIRPDIERDEFEADWAEFQALKAKRRMQ